MVRLSRTAGFNHLSDPKRDYVRIVFLDVFDPKKFNDPFPEEALLRYRIQPHFRKDTAPAYASPEAVVIHLPITQYPAQTPKLLSAGIAQTAFVTDEHYASTQPRRRCLWLEMADAPADEKTVYYVRMLTYAPDPMLCAMTEALALQVQEAPPLAVPPEPVRVLIPDMQNDSAGKNAMQPMVPQEGGTAPRFFLVPLPPGLHEASDELFGFFSYEIRLGYKKDVWSTGQAAFGRPLVVNGVQHPAPALLCSNFREKTPGGAKLVVTAPFATSVFDGKNVSPIYPRTTLWCFLYAQTKQADGKGWRNLLLASRQMKYVKPGHGMEEGTKRGVAEFKQPEIRQWLQTAGLPAQGVAMSVLCVEMFPHRNDYAWETPPGAEPGRPVFSGVLGAAITRTANDSSDQRTKFNPLVEGLGRYRIYRTSPLTRVEDICCTDCG